MKFDNQEQKAALRAPGLKLIAVGLATLGTALANPGSSFAAPHTPLSPNAAVADADMLGEPKGSDIAVAIEERVTEGAIRKSLGGKVSKGAQAAARQAYAQEVFAPLWTRSAATKLLEANTACAENGFDSGYTDAQIKAMVDARFTGTAEARARADIRLTGAWLTLASRMSGGLSDEGGMVKSTEARPTRSDLVTALRSAAKSDPIAAMERFASLSPQYGALKGKLATYRRHAANGGWMRVRDGKEMLEPGMDDPRVPALRERLRAEGFVPPRRYAALGRDVGEAPTVYDATLEEQVKAFQAAHGLARDGVVGPSTLAALNESVESKIRRIQRSMDHWRTNPNPGDQYIWVNIPSYRAEGWNNGVREISMDTIVGKKRTPTTAFSDEIEYIVVNPKWFLPIGLFKRQKLRKLQKDPGYAARKKYYIRDRETLERVSAHDIDWNAPNVARRYQMIQTAGPHNALGQLKIIFPNKHSIYLHDTPGRHLFERDVRALSSGCIRLKDPVAMANWLTDNDPGVDTKLFNVTLEDRERERFYLDHHVNVHLTYLPAAVAPDGSVEFPADIYGKFNTPTLAKGTYPDNMETFEEPADFLLVNGRSAGPGKDVLQ